MSVRSLRKQIEELSRKRGLGTGDSPTCEACGEPLNEPRRAYFYHEPKDEWDPEEPCWECRKIQPPHLMALIIEIRNVSREDHEDGEHHFGGLDEEPSINLQED